MAHRAINFLKYQDGSMFYALVKTESVKGSLALHHGLMLTIFQIAEAFSAILTLLFKIDKPVSKGENHE